MALYNRISSRELRNKLFRESFGRITVSFYRYVSLDDPQGLRDSLYRWLDSMHVFGRIYLAREGINAQASIPEQNWNAFVSLLDSYPEFKGLNLNRAIEDNGKSFFVLKIKVRARILADGIRDQDFDPSKSGIYLDARQFNELSEQPGTVVVDMRNHYEYEVGHFEQALEVPSETFRQQLPMAASLLAPFRQQALILYCTGGIRCEKASAYLLHRGFTRVYHLKGGILAYARQVKELGIENKFLGSNFVFDERMGERVGEGIISRCHQCGRPCDSHTNCRNEACHILFLQCPDCAARYVGCCSEECLRIFKLPDKERRAYRRGRFQERKVHQKELPLRPTLGPRQEQRPGEAD